MRTFVVLGAHGQLGRAMLAELERRDISAISLTVNEVDLSKPESIALPLTNVSGVINCAAYTNVDGAESDEDTALTVNATAVSVIAEACKSANVPLVHFSTDYVFDGRARTPIPPDAKRAPLSAYGRTKAKGEELLEGSGADFLLVRTSWVYAPWGNNFVKTIARLVSEKDELRVVDDQRGRPTHVFGLAERSLDLLERGERGIFHVTDAGECTWFGFASAIVEQLKSSCKVMPCTTAEFPRPAPRPAYGVLDTTKADDLLGPAKHYRDYLAGDLG